MAHKAIWYHTDLPKEIISILEKDLKENFDYQMEDSLLYNGVKNYSKRNSKNAWIPTSHWISGFLWHYIERSNRENFLYDISNIDCESIQYTQYSEGNYYKWHSDTGISENYYPGVKVTSDKQKLANDFVLSNSELTRKLSFVLQLSDPDEYEGGNLQILDENGNSFFAPRKLGTLILFDSRSQHRVCKVTKGIRKTLVGWVVGPRWR